MIKIFKSYISYFKKKKEIFLINSDEDRDFVISLIEDHKLIAIDTEFEWRRTYYPILSLIQIATKKNIFLIDCVKCRNLGWLKNILENKKKLIIFHSVRSDATVLNTNLKIKVNNTYDVQIAEKKINGGETLNYGDLVENYFSVHLDKSETNSNWLKRPLEERQLSYAANDVNYLLELYEKQIKILKKQKLENDTFQESMKETKLGNQELHISRLKKLKKYSKFEKKLFMWRENFAKKQNITPTQIFKNNLLKTLAKELNKKDLNEKNLNEIIKDSFISRKLIEDMT